jgi:hypothetical protein
VSHVDELDLLRERYAQVPAATEAQRHRARARLLAAAQESRRAGRVIDLDRGTVTVLPPPRGTARDRDDAGRRRVARPRLAAALAVSLVVLLALGAAWWSMRNEPPALPVTGRVGDQAPAPSRLPVATSADLDYRGDPELFGAGVGVTVVAPTTPGPWPIVVLTADERRDALEPMARELASQGVVVYLAKTRVDEPMVSEPRAVEGMASTTCLLGFADETAERYGGRGDQVVVVGVGYDAWTSLVAVLRGDDVEPTPCVAAAAPAATPTAFVGLGGGLPCDDIGCPFQPVPGHELDPFSFLDRRREVAVRLYLPSHGLMWNTPEAYERLAEELRAAGHDAVLRTMERSSTGDLYLPGRDANRQVVAHILELARGS